MTQKLESADQDLMQVRLRILPKANPQLYKLLSAITDAKRGSRARTAMVLALAERGLVLEALLNQQLSPSEDGEEPPLVAHLMSQVGLRRKTSGAPTSPARPAGQGATLANNGPLPSHLDRPPALPRAAPADPTAASDPAVASPTIASPPAPRGPATWGLEVDDSPHAEAAPPASAPAPSQPIPPSQQDGPPRPSLAESSVLKRLVHDHPAHTMRPPDSEPK